jgi:hypothetical protein
MDEGAAVYNCLLCDSYALLTLGLLPDRKLARGLNGKKAYEDLLGDFQEKRASKRKTYFLACPTCNAFAAASDPNKGFDQVRQGEYLREGLAVLTPCHLVAFDDEELPPVYRDESSQGGKPKWKICQGLGPPGLEVDKTRTGRLHKPSLGQFGIDVQPLTLPAELERDRRALARAVREACAFAEGIVQQQSSERVVCGEAGGDGGDGDASAREPRYAVNTEDTEKTETEIAEKAFSELRAWRAESCGGRPVLENWTEARAAAIARGSPETRRRMEQAAIETEANEC